MEKFLAVCGFGVGSSMVLKMTIEKVCKDKGIEVEVENTDISSAKGTNADAIFTSQELGDELNTGLNLPVYPIKRYMDKEEVAKAIEDYMQNHK